MASMMSYNSDQISILDPGAGIGSLFVACIDKIVQQDQKPKKISITAYEIDSSLYAHLKNSLKQCKALCKKNNIQFSSKLIKKDFIKETIHNQNKDKFTHVILNPPYKKINTLSSTHHILNKYGKPSTNLYTAFITLSEELLQNNNGQMVFISPRSFCNGSYFESFRKTFLESMSIKRIHIFDSRSSSFKDDKVLQENVIVHAIKGKKINNICVSSSSGPNDSNTPTQRQIKKEHIVYPNDPQRFIHIISDAMDIQISNKMGQLESTLQDLNIDVSTGKIVDFRINKELKHKPETDTVPLVRPYNIILDGSILFPIQNKKENYIKTITKKSQNLLIRNGNYVLVKRFTAKEEKRRIVASVWQGNKFDFESIGFENRVNYFHSNGHDLEYDTAKGLALFLNSSLVDLYFRQFNGNTQVNATDLRYMRYPTRKQLKTLSIKIPQKYPKQGEIDKLIEKEVFGTNKKFNESDPIAAKQKIVDATSILKQLGFPNQQQNDRSALTLLALLDLKPEIHHGKNQRHV